MVSNPLLTFLGRRGRPQVVAVLAAPSFEGVRWSLRRLAHEAGVPHPVAGRAVRELEAFGAVEVARPGRDAAIQWRPATPAARFLATLHVPDLRRAAVEAFREVVPYECVLWTSKEEWPDPLAPNRIAVVAADPDDAVEEAAAGLDAVAAAGLGKVELSVVRPEELLGDDPVARRIQEARAPGTS